jgi:hypothetical protein
LKLNTPPAPVCEEEGLKNSCSIDGDAKV